jgi:hypothetical protein
VGCLSPAMRAATARAPMKYSAAGSAATASTAITRRRLPIRASMPS